MCSGHALGGSGSQFCYINGRAVGWTSTEGGRWLLHATPDTAGSRNTANMEPRQQPSTWIRKRRQGPEAAGSRQAAKARGSTHPAGDDMVIQDCKHRAASQSSGRLPVTAQHLRGQRVRKAWSASWCEQKGQTEADAQSAHQTTWQSDCVCPLCVRYNQPWPGCAILRHTVLQTTPQRTWRMPPKAASRSGSSHEPAHQDSSPLALPPYAAW